MKITLIRHGKTKGNTLQQYIGTIDEPLSAEGAREIVALKENGLYPDVTKLWASPKKRCLMTAEIIYPHLSQDIMDGLQEMNFGDFEGKTWQEITADPKYADFGSSADRMYFPNGESIEQFGSRVSAAFDRIIEQGESCAVVSHGGVIMALLAKHLGGHFYDYQIKNGCGYTLDFDGLHCIGARGIEA